MRDATVRPDGWCPGDIGKIALELRIQLNNIRSR